MKHLYKLMRNNYGKHENNFRTVNFPNGQFGVVEEHKKYAKVRSEKRSWK